MLSSHDVPRHASRLALPADIRPRYLATQQRNRPPRSTRTRALRRARAATLMMLALPGSAYLYQGEELGLLEVADLPVEALQDPVWERTCHTLKGRDGCRVPLPWTTTGSSFGFGANGAWLPQPNWFGTVSVQTQVGNPYSTLQMYRSALRLRRQIQTADSEVTWSRKADHSVLDFTRSNGWRSITNFARTETDLPPGRILFASRAVTDHSTVPPETTVWLQT